LPGFTAVWHGPHEPSEQKPIKLRLDQPIQFTYAMGLAADARVLTIWVGTLICISLVHLIFLPGVFAQPQQAWDKLVAAAEKEGEVTIYGQARAGVAKSIHAFAEAYPKIKINFVGGQGSDLSKKVFAERRAGKNLVDVAVGGGPPMILYHKAGVLKSLPEILISPEVRDQSKWWDKKHFYADSDNRYVFMSQGDAGSGICRVPADSEHGISESKMAIDRRRKPPGESDGQTESMECGEALPDRERNVESKGAGWSNRPTAPSV